MSAIVNDRAKRIQTVLFLAFIGAFFLLNLLLPDKTFSEQENRYLQTAPRFSFSALFSGKFTSDFETYLTDQFAFRDGWIMLKARTELAIGKRENNGVYLCEDETLIEPFTAPKQADLDFSLDAVNALAKQAGVPVYFALIPSASEIWRGKLPDGTPNDSQTETIEHAYAYVHTPTADVLGALQASDEEPIFYRTDHHWTTLGAYYGYTAIADAMGLNPAPLSDYTERIVSREFYGTAYSSSGFSWVAPDSISAYVPSGGVTVTNYPEGQPVEGSMYVETFLEAKDKYKFFYGGNTPLLTIETGNTDAPSLLILRDSYMDAMSPFLTAHFSRIHILDLRYYKTSLRAYIEENGIDNILVCYNVKNCSEDGNIFLMQY